MMSSDRKINYNLRPSKSMERKMILEVLKEFCTPSEATNYQYIGFGASFFVDFKLMHRVLNITNMISIEAKLSNQKRCEFNKPYNCINLHFGLSRDELPKIDLDSKKSIIWLDYDKALKDFMIDDIEITGQKLNESSFLIISLRKEFDEKTKDEFEEQFGDVVPADLVNEDLEPKKSAKTIRKIFLNKLEEVLKNRFADQNDEEKLVFIQTFNLVYNDHAPMYTLGGYFMKKKNIEKIKKFKFNSYPFVTDSEDSLNISTPIITNKEYHLLNSKLPSDSIENFLNDPDIDFVPKEHKKNYFNNYKMYPSYFELADL